MNMLNNNQNEGQEYYLCYKEDLPNTLTINKKPKQVLKHLYKLSTYVWINAQGQKQIICPQEIQKRSEVPIIFVKTLKEFKQNFQNQHNIILISPISLIKRIYFNLKPMIKTFKIISILFYGVVEQIIDNAKYMSSSYFSSVENVIDQIIQKKYTYAQPNYSNFISAQHSNNYTKTMFAIFNQQTCTNKILEEFKVLALMSFPTFQQSIQTFVSLYLQKGQLGEKQSIHWFIKESFLYRFMSLMLKTTSQPTCLMLIQPYFRDLFKAIQHKYKKQQIQSFQESENQIKSFKKFTCYRGAFISDDEIKFFKQNTNKCVQNLGFLSTSRNLSIAKNFQKNALIQIQVEDEQRNLELDYGFCDVSQYSPLHSNEEEILFNHLNSFKILDIRMEDTFNELWRVRLKYGEMARIALLETKKLAAYQFQCKQRAEEQIKLIKRQVKLSDLLIEGNLPGCQEYCEKFTQMAYKSKNIEHILNAHYMKAHIAKNEQDQKTIQIEYRKCLELIKIRKDNEETFKYEELICKLDNLVGKCAVGYQNHKQQSNLQVKPYDLKQ